MNKNVELSLEEGKIEQEVKKAVEKLTAGDKIQLELDRKNQVLKIWKLKLDKIEVKEVKDVKEKN